MTTSEHNTNVALYKQPADPVSLLNYGFTLLVFEIFQLKGFGAASAPS